MSYLNNRRRDMSQDEKNNRFTVFLETVEAHIRNTKEGGSTAIGLRFLLNELSKVLEQGIESHQKRAVQYAAMLKSYMEVGFSREEAMSLLIAEISSIKTSPKQRTPEST